MDVFINIFIAFVVLLFYFSMYTEYPRAFIGTIFWVAFGSFFSWALGNNIDFLDQRVIDFMVGLGLLAFCAYRPYENRIRHAMFASAEMHAAFLVLAGWGWPILFALYQAASGEIRREGLASLWRDWMPTSLGIGLFGVIAFAVLQAATRFSSNVNSASLWRAAGPMLSRRFDQGRHAVRFVYRAIFGPGLHQQGGADEAFGYRAGDRHGSADAGPRANQKQERSGSANEKRSKQSSGNHQTHNSKSQGSAAPDDFRRPWWEVLGLPESATWPEVKAQRTKLLKQIHPDVHQGLPPELREAAEKRTAAINAAYDRAKRSFRTG